MLLREIMLVVKGPHIHVAFGFIGEVVEDAAPADDLYDGQIDLSLIHI